MADRIYAPAPAIGPIETALAGTTTVERARRKAVALSEVTWTGNKSFTLEGVTITVQVLQLTGGGRVVDFFVTAIDSNGVNLPLDNPYRFYNPPYKIHNGTWRVENGDDVPNMEENAKEAAKQMLLAAVKNRARQLGWQG